MSECATRDARALCRAMFDAAVTAALPEKVLPPFIPSPPKGRTVVVGAGKAAAAMARVFEDRWKDHGNGPLSGLVVTRYGHAVPCSMIEVVEAAHPVPDAAGETAARRILDLARALGPDDLLVALISGGGSALLPLAAPGLSLADKQAVTAALLRSGQPISAMNTLRKHLSGIKGGRLGAAAFPARCVGLLISDIPGDEAGMIASGPTVGDDTTLAMARALVAPLGRQIPARVHAALIDPANETPTPDDSTLQRCETHVIAAPALSLAAAADVARKAGFKPVLLGDAIEGPAREVARDMAQRALLARADGNGTGQRIALISGGETTVTIRGDGTGGRNVEFLMALAEALNGAEGIYGLAADTDGVDGGAEVAGAIIDPSTCLRAQKIGYPLASALARNDGHGLFSRLNDQVVTGPTLTNVNDFRVILIAP